MSNLQMPVKPFFSAPGRHSRECYSPVAVGIVEEDGALLVAPGEHVGAGVGLPMASIYIRGQRRVIIDMLSLTPLVSTLRL